MELSLTKDQAYQIASDSLNRKYEEIRKGILAANPELVSFDLVRSGDEITVLFGVRRGPDRFDVRLLGNKHDYYRLSMGVRLEETLTGLAAADPNTEAAGIALQGDTLRVQLRYTGPLATAPPELAPAAPAPIPDPPAAAPAPTPASSTERPRRAAAPPRPAPPPPGAESEVAVPGAEARAEAPPSPGAVVVRESSAVSAGGAPSVAGPRSEEGEAAFREAQKQDTLQGWTRFLERHPESPRAAEARDRAAALREEAAYRTALQRNDAEGYQAFLDHFPSSSRLQEIQARLRAVEEERRRAAAESQARQAADKRRRDAYSEARKLDTAESYRIFLTVFPDGPEAAEARKQLAAIEADDKDFQAARGSLEGVEAYLKARPKGRHAPEARRLADEARARALGAEWESARSAGTPEALEGFLARWPQAPQAGEARTALEGLRRAQAPTPRPESGRSPGVPVLAAPQVAQPPAVDGRADDPAWRHAEAIDLPVTDGTAINTVRLRAVHDGARLYLLAQWSDPSQDTLYRPWRWDTAQRTYQQSADLDDALAVSWYRTPPSDPCMLQGDEHDADTWLWRAHWSEVSGHADDGRLRVSRGRIPQSNPYATRAGSGQVWVKQEPDEGAPAWFFFIPVEFQGNVVASYRPQEPRGSRSDVRARGIWTAKGDGGTWSVELSRALDTGRSDDVSFAVGQPLFAAFAVYDKSDKGKHLSSGLMRLELRGR